MCIIYILGALIICLLNITSIPSVIALIFNDAFTGTAVAGGSIGTVVIWGVRRAIFSNEAGLGSASIAHAAVKTNHPIREGVVASIGPFIDTIIVCTATAIIIVLSGHYKSDSYSPKSAIIDFENSQMKTAQENWMIKNSDDGQGNRLSYVTNDETLASFTSSPIKVVETKNTWYGTPVTEVIGDGIQFKTKRSRGKYALIIRDKNDNKLISLKLHGDDKFFFTSTAKSAKKC